MLYGSRSFLREGPCSQGASWGVRGSEVPPWEFLNLYGIFNRRFSTSFSRETARTKDRQGVDEGWGGRDPGFLPPQHSTTPWRSLVRDVPQGKLVENGGTEGAPRGDGPSLNIPVFFTLLLQCTCIFLLRIHSVICHGHINVNFRWHVGHLTTRHSKFTLMWPWQVTLWIHPENMHVHHSNTNRRINILRIT
jgi:hypothetical protein